MGQTERIISSLIKPDLKHRVKNPNSQEIFPTMHTRFTLVQVALFTLSSRSQLAQTGWNEISFRRVTCYYPQTFLLKRWFHSSPLLPRPRNLFIGHRKRRAIANDLHFRFEGRHVCWKSGYVCCVHTRNFFVPDGILNTHVESRNAVNSSLAAVENEIVNI